MLSLYNPTVLKYPMLMLSCVWMLCCFPAYFPLSFTSSILLSLNPAARLLYFSKQHQLLLRSHSHNPCHQSYPVRLLFIPSFTSFPASQSPHLQPPPVSSPVFILLPSTLLKVSMYARPSLLSLVQLPPQPQPISGPCRKNSLSRMLDKSRASKLIIY